MYFNGNILSNNYVPVTDNFSLPLLLLTVRETINKNKNNNNNNDNWGKPERDPHTQVEWRKMYVLLQQSITPIYMQ